MKSAEEIKTFCAECGPNIAIDEDGSCHGCGNGAFGQGIEKINLLIRKAREEVREECAKIAGDYAAIYHGENTFGKEYQAIAIVYKAIRALDLK